MAPSLQFVFHINCNFLIYKIVLLRYPASLTKQKNPLKAFCKFCNKTHSSQGLQKLEGICISSAQNLSRASILGILPT